jgi:hypothetical protein
MRTDLAPGLDPRLVKLIPMLGSPHDGEVVASARALGRTLGSRGLTFHDLAAALAGSASMGVQIVHPSWAAMSWQKRIATLDDLLGSGMLSPWEMAFCRKIRAWLHLRPSSQLSDKQRAKIEELIGEMLQ